MNNSKNSTGHIAALISIIIWGTTFISTKILLNDFSPIEILFFRFTIGLIALFIVCPHRFKVNDKKHELYFIAAGLSGVTLYFLLENIALTYTFASNVGVIISISPFFTAIFAHMFLDGEKLKPQFFIGFAVAICGIFLISFNSNMNLKLNPLGDILAILAAILWAVYSILTKKISSFQYNSIQTTRRIFIYGIIFMVPALFMFDFSLNLNRLNSMTNLFNIIYLGLGASALCFVTWGIAVKVLGAVKTSVYIYMVPVITVVTSAIVLNETITPITLIGTALTLTGLFVSENKITFKSKVIE